MTRAIADFIRVPAQARLQIGELTSYLEHALQTLQEVDGHLRDSSQTVPDVLHVLHDINRMAEVAVVQVLDQSEALVEDGRIAARLLSEARSAANPSSPLAAQLAEVEAVMARSNERAMTIMLALEFQDLSSQKVQQAFKVLESVVERVRTIQNLVFGERMVEPPAPSGARTEAEAPSSTMSAQDLADELLRGFTR
jgi:chemotaxis regulatin CheY-phosphate phosphatase CheZ